MSEELFSEMRKLEERGREIAFHRAEINSVERARSWIWDLMFIYSKIMAGFRVKRIRLRKISEGAYHGDVIVCVDPARSVEEVHRDLDLAEERIRSKYRADVTIHVEPE